MLKVISKIKPFFTPLGVIAALLTAIIAYKEYIIKHSSPKLQYKAECYDILQGDKLVKFPNQNFDFFIEKQYISSNKKENIEELSFCKLLIINTGKKELKSKDLYAKTPLSINFEIYSKPIWIFIDKKNTQKYINFNIKSITENKVTFSFDTIKANDSVGIGLLFNRDITNNILTIEASSRNFNTVPPLDYDSAKTLGSWEEQNKLKPLDISWIILQVCLFLFLSYLTYILFMETKK